MLTLSIEEIMRGLDDFELDIGITYLEDQRLEDFHIQPLYKDWYMLLARDGTLPEELSEISRQQAPKRNS